MSSSIMAATTSIPEFFAGRSVFITGATGFMGKVLVEKLLRSCPEVKTLYLLMRPKKGKDISERLEDVTNCKLFSKLKCEQPEFKSKLVPVSGDILHDGLGVDQPTMDTLIQEVSVVFHFAATIRFDEEMKLSVELNVRGVRRMLDLCHRLGKLEAFVHVSTAYANCDQSYIGERVYPPPLHHSKLLSAVGWLDKDSLEILTPKMLGTRPNTYTYTKAVAETLVYEEAGSLPAAIVRPSIVGAAYREPVRGWVDNLTGPAGLFAAIGAGVLRALKMDVKKRADVIPVDLAASMVIAAAWYTAARRPSEVKVYNCTLGSLNEVSWGRLGTLVYESTVKNPFHNIARLPSILYTTNVLRLKVNLLLDHAVPAYLMDFFLWLSGRKKMFVRIQEKLQRTASSLSFFTSNEWTFENANLLLLLDQMTPSDKKTFAFHPKMIHWSSYTEDYGLGIKQFVFKEELSDLPRARRALTRLRILHYIFNFALIAVGGRLLYHRVRILRVLLNAAVALLLKILQKIPGFARSV